MSGGVTGQTLCAAVAAAGAGYEPDALPGEAAVVFVVAGAPANDDDDDDDDDDEYQQKSEHASNAHNIMGRI